MVSQVTAGTGRAVTLRFGGDRVDVHEVSPARGRALRLVGGGLLTGFGLALVAAGAGGWLGTALWIAVAVLVVAGPAAGTIWWLVLARRDRRRAPETLPVTALTGARSSADGGTVTVTLELATGRERTFSARGQAGAQLSAAFGELLGVPRD